MKYSRKTFFCDFVKRKMLRLRDYFFEIFTEEIFYCDFFKRKINKIHKNRVYTAKLSSDSALNTFSLLWGLTTFCHFVRVNAASEGALRNRRERSRRSLLRSLCLAGPRRFPNIQPAILTSATAVGSENTCNCCMTRIFEI